MNTLLLDVLHGKKVDTPPVWLMRQAGRYMGAYQKLRSEHSLNQLFHTPELAAKVTLLPIDAFSLDAAILFSDILVMAEVFGCSLHFPDKQGPVIHPLLSVYDPLPELLNVENTLSYVFQTLDLLKPQLKVPLLGFCGGPFTVATYLMKEDLATWLEHPQKLHALLALITRGTILYLRQQIAHGVSAIQIFDSWASRLTPQERVSFCYPYVKELIQVIKEENIPVLFFCRDSSLFPQELLKLEADALSFDWQVPLDVLSASLPEDVCVQGNFDPHLLETGSIAEVRAHAKTLKNSMRGKQRWIANLGHGVLPKTPEDNVRAFIEAIRS